MGSSQSVQHLRFPDGTSSYMRTPSDSETRIRTVPIKYQTLHDRGAYLLSQMLGLDIVPETDLLRSRTDWGKPGLASIQEGIEGNTLGKTTKAQRQAALEERNRLIELYLLTAIGYDTDKYNRNVVLETGTNKIYAIDNALSGGNPLVIPTSVNRTSSLAFPRLLKKLIRTEKRTLSKQGINDHPRLPDVYIDKLRNFVDNRDTYSKELTPYYGEKTVNQIFRRAEAMLAEPVLLQPWQLTLWFRWQALSDKIRR